LTLPRELLACGDVTHHTTTRGDVVGDVVMSCADVVVW
jgi:hypothetical protein